MSQHDKYIQKKLREIEGEIAVVSGVANMIGCMTGKCTDGVIEARDKGTARIEKIVYQIIKRVTKDQTPN